MIIELGKCISDIKFGMTESQIMDIWGVPDKSYIDEYESKYLQYFDKRLVLKLDLDIDYRLGWIEVYNNEAILLNKKLFDMSKQSILKFLIDQFSEEPEFEDYGAFESYTFQESWLELQFELGKLRNINFGNLFDKNDEPVFY